MNKRLIYIVTAVFVIVGALLIGLRIREVNDEVSVPPMVAYREGEYVPLGEDYYWQEQEKSPGYEIRVVSSQIKSYADFVSEYGEDETYLDEGYRPEYVIDLEVSIKNTNTDDETGRGIDFVQMRVQTENDSFQVNSELFTLVRPDLAGVLGVRVRPGTEVTLHLPYARSVSMDGYESYDAFVAKDFYLLLSMYPVKKVISLFF